MGDGGRDAERLVEARVRAALPEGARAYPNVGILARTRATGPGHDAEADLVVLHPEHGLLVIEVKSGEPGRDHAGHWYLGDRRLERSPVKQAEDAKHDLVHAITALPEWPSSHQLRAGHAVAFPDADLATLPRGHALLGPDIVRDIVLDAEALSSSDATRRALERAWAWWTGDGTRGEPLTPTLFARIDEYLAPTLELHRLVRRDVDDARDRLLAAKRAQLTVLNQHRRERRVEVVGPAGSGKSLVAVEKARRLAKEGFRTLYLCFNQPLATAVLRSIEEEGEPPDRRPVVNTFHGLCETMGRRAGTLPPKPARLPGDWFDVVLPKALDDAITALPDERFGAVIVDEGQDFELGWLESLEFLFRNPDDGVLWVFHDPGQALYRDDVVDRMANMVRLDLYEDYRSPVPVAELAAGFYRGDVRPEPMGEGGRPAIVKAVAPGRATVEEVRRRLHDLVEVQGVRPWDIVVLSGQSAPNSDVWRERRFGNLELWNGAIDDGGASLRLAADQVPDEPPDAGIVRFETVRRFKGLERPVVILCELPDEHARLDQLLYTALTRATALLVVLVPPKLSQRFASMGSR
jgi:hypothetical protein